MATEIVRPGKRRGALHAPMTTSIVGRLLLLLLPRASNIFSLVSKEGASSGELFQTSRARVRVLALQVSRERMRCLLRFLTDGALERRWRHSEKKKMRALSQGVSPLLLEGRVQKKKKSASNPRALAGKNERAIYAYICLYAYMLICL